MTCPKTGGAICLGMTLLSLIHVSRAAEDPRAREAVERVERLFSSTSSIATVTMQVSNEDGDRSISMRIWSLGEKLLVRITAPPEDAGTAILKVGGGIWSYLPESDRTVKLPASMVMSSWMGSDFTIDDLVQQTVLTRDYSVSRSFEGERGGVAVSEYALTPKPGAAVVWGKIILQIRQADSVPTWQGYYAEDGRLIRELFFSKHELIDGRLIPTRLVMRPAAKPDTRTTIEYEDIAFDVPISEDTFSLDNLK